MGVTQAAYEVVAGALANLEHAITTQDVVGDNVRGHTAWVAKRLAGAQGGISCGLMIPPQESIVH